MKYLEIITSLKNKNFDKVYFLHGEESYYIDKISDFISKNTLNKEEKDFNFTTLYGKETDCDQIISEAKQYPFGAEYRVVLVKEAQYLNKIELLENYLRNPTPSTLLAICFKSKKLDKRKSIYKTLKTCAKIFESNKLYDDKIPSWINAYCSAKTIKIDDKSCAILSEYLGNDLSKISNELDKLIISCEGEINSKIIEKNIGISKDYNVFELQNALGKKNIVQVNRIIKYFNLNNKTHPLILTINSLFSFFQKVLIYKQLRSKSRSEIASSLKVNPYFLSQYELASNNYSVNQLQFIFTYIKEYELRMKGVNNKNTSHQSLLIELIFKILHT